MANWGQGAKRNLFNCTAHLHSELKSISIYCCGFVHSFVRLPTCDCIEKVNCNQWPPEGLCIYIYMYMKKHEDDDVSGKEVKWSRKRRLNETLNEFMWRNEKFSIDHVWDDQIDSSLFHKHNYHHHQHHHHHNPHPHRLRVATKLALTQSRKPREHKNIYSSRAETNSNF